jgi:hypothetical protein
VDTQAILDKIRLLESMMEESRLGFSDPPYSMTIFCNRQHGGLWYKLSDDGPIVLEDKSLRGFMTGIKVETVERRKKETQKLHIFISAGRNRYKLEAGAETEFANGLAQAIAAAHPKVLKNPIRIQPVPGNDDKVLFCKVWITDSAGIEKPLYIPEEEQLPQEEALSKCLSLFNQEQEEEPQAQGQPIAPPPAEPKPQPPPPTKPAATKKTPTKPAATQQKPTEKTEEPSIEDLWLEDACLRNVGPLETGTNDIQYAKFTIVTPLDEYPCYATGAIAVHVNGILQNGTYVRALVRPKRDRSGNPLYQVEQIEMVVKDLSEYWARAEAAAALLSYSKEKLISLVQELQPNAEKISDLSEDNCLALCDILEEALTAEAGKGKRQKSTTLA